MRKVLSLLLFLLMSTVAFAQNLSKASQSSFYTYVYRVKEQTVQALYMAQPLSEADLSVPIDSFLTAGGKMPKLPAGNYIKVFANENKLHYQLIEYRSAYLKLISNDAKLQFLLLDQKGNEIKDAAVSVNGRKVYFNSLLGYWHTSIPRKKDNLIRIYYKGLANFVSLSSEKAGKTINRYPSTPKVKRGELAGYMVFSKPKYKPNDTVRLKAFLLKGKKHRPMNLPVGVRLISDQGAKILAMIKPAYPGSFDYSFRLHDSLGLKLDKRYMIELFQDDQVLRRGSFRYEEYELKSSSFSFRASNQKHVRGTSQVLFFNAKDENDLNILDGRVEILLLSNFVSAFNRPKMFIPDTLWKHQFLLDAVGETKLVLPDSIFPDADLSYRIQATFLNANNEKKQFDQHISYVSKLKPDWEIALRGDSLYISSVGLTEKSNPLPIDVTVFNSDKDTIDHFASTLPLQLKANARAAYYELKLDSMTKLVDMEGFNPSIYVNLQHGADSLSVQVNNPSKVPFWYTVKKGNKVIDHGQAVALNYKKAVGKKGLATFAYSYIWADQTYSREVTAQFLDKMLQLNVKQPMVVAPGEKSSIEIDVVDAEGKAVKDVNITAYGFTSKFNRNGQGIPYLGKLLQPTPKGIVLEADEGLNLRSNKLDWSRWKHELGLDSMTYFKFTHPEPVYRNETRATSGLTQIVPFVIAQGEILPVAVLYINRQPVYFSKAEQEPRYAFRVDGPFVQLHFRLKNRLVMVDSVAVRPGSRLVISFNLDAVNQRHISVSDQLPELSLQEADVLHAYMIKVEDTYAPRFATIKLPDVVHLLTPAAYSGRQRDGAKLIGPLSYNLASFEVKDLPPQTFISAPGYTYSFHPGLIRQKSTKENYLFDRNLTSVNAPGYKDQVLTNDEVDSLWLSYLDLRSHTTSLFYNQAVRSNHSGLLQIKIKKEKGEVLPLIKQVLIYRVNEPDFLNVYAGRVTDLGRLAAGTYKLVLILKGDNYVMMEDLQISADGVNLYEVSLKNPRKKDAFSTKIAALIMQKSIALPEENLRTLEKIKQTFSIPYVSSYTKTMSGHIYDDKEKFPLSGVHVKIKGTASLTATNVQGFFSLKVPENGTLQISYVGYDIEEVKVNHKGENKIFLKASESLLSEDVVAGYGDVPTRNINELLQGRVEGMVVKQNLMAPVMIRGYSLSGQDKSSDHGVEPLYIVDGMEQANPMNRLKPEEIADITVLKPDHAAAVYGAQGAHGVIIIRTKKAVDLAQQTNAGSGENKVSIRRNFADDVFWQPQLMTDAAGKVKFDVNFPDDLTNWSTFFMAMNANQQSGYAEGNIKAFKPLSALLAVPTFSIAGDQFKPVGKLLNYAATPTRVKRQFSFNGQSVLDGDVTVKDAHLDTLMVKAEGAESLTLRYSLQTGSRYSDGEERIVPVFKAGVLETKGVFDVLERDTAVTHQFNSALGSVTVRLEASVLPVLLAETEHLERYAYFCNEQMASKLKALLVQKRIMAHLNKPFKQEKAIRELIKRLQDTRREEGTWGWWKNSDGELWISRHIVEAFIDAEKSGYETQLNKTQLINHLLYQLASYHGMYKLEALELLQKLDAKLDYKIHLDRHEAAIKQQKGAPSVYEQLRLMHLKKQIGLPVDVNGLLKYSHQTMLGNTYFGKANSYHFFDNSIQTTLLAYQVLRGSGADEQTLKKVRNYFLEQRADGHWRNTYESSLILETILTDLFKEGSKLKPSKVTLTSNHQQQKISVFPYTAVIAANTPLEIQKEGDLPVYFSAYQEFWNSNPEKVSKDFTVNTWFGANRENAITKLKGGEVIMLNAEVDVRANSEYVMIEIPIPAGTSYDEKLQNWWGKEVHREYGKEKVTIFCRSLKEGKHLFTVKLMPRYDGTYTLNPAKASLMYFPVFYGREQLKKVQIGK